ncbi:FKBP-type peptidyl-prolyl cis-trans isomerase [Methanococcoides burtonii]|nr:peptidylprolyl isomerase [Methanococcoides burtonii]
MVQEGDLISVNYIGQLDDGTIFDTSFEDVAKEAGQYNPARGYEPLEFTVGASRLIAGFDAGVVGMTVGEEKTVVIPAAEAYGEYDEERVQPVPISQLKEKDIEPEVGMLLNTISGQQVPIVRMDETNAYVDNNYPLAGETLTFQITLVSIGQD